MLKKFLFARAPPRSIIPDYVGIYVIKKVRLEPNKLLAYVIEV